MSCNPSSFNIIIIQDIFPRQPPESFTFKDINTGQRINLCLTDPGFNPFVFSVQDPNVNAVEITFTAVPVDGFSPPPISIGAGRSSGTSTFRLFVNNVGDYAFEVVNPTLIPIRRLINTVPNVTIIGNK